MDIELQKIEGELKQLVPLQLSGDVLDRLDGAMTEVKADSLSEIEGSEMGLAELVPLVAPADMLDRLDAAMSRWHETVPVEEKVISLEKPTRKSFFPQWRSVAAVALFGASGALYLTQGNTAPAQASAATQSTAAPGPIALATFQQQGASSSRVVDFHEGNVISNGNGQALRCVAVKVANEVSFLNAKGEKVTVKKPQFKVIFVPVDVD